MNDIRCGEVMLSLLASLLASRPLPNAWDQDLHFDRLLSLARHHGVAGMVARAILDAGLSLSPEQKALLNRQIFSDAFAEAGQSAAAEKASQILNREGIAHVILKGYVLRKFYPSPEMRTSCDIDILISPENTEKAKNALVGVGFTFVSEEEKDLHFSYPPSVHIELHRSLAEKVYRDGSEFFGDALERALPDQGYRMRQTDEDFYVYMIFHLAKHFILGGSGVRSVIDIYLYRKNVVLDENACQDRLETLSLAEFEKKIVSLGRVWMGEEEPSAFSERLTSFVLDAGAFGHQENRVGLSIGNEKKGRLRYFLSRAFPGRSTMQYRFPVLKKAPILLPFCWFWRFFDVFRPARKKRVRQEMKLGGTMDRSRSEKIVSLYRELGIYEVL